MIVVGLTGASGSGKGRICGMLEKRGFPCIDTDAIVHRLYEANTPCTARLAEIFGKGILSPDGTVNRRALSTIVFTNPDSLAKLNQTVHFYVLECVRKRIRALSDAGENLVFVDAPQLFESGLDRDCDFTIGVIADPDIRLRRLMARDRLPEEQIRLRMQNQHDDRFFRENCDFVILNNGLLDGATQDGQTPSVAEQLDRILPLLGGEVRT